MDTYKDQTNMKIWLNETYRPKKSNDSNIINHNRLWGKLIQYSRQINHDGM